MKVVGKVQPTSRSIVYNFEIKYNLGDAPRIIIVSPKLRKNDKGEAIPHLYPNGDLCLYRPAYREFKGSDFICNTIIPWISLWLYYYEIWLISGDWLGGGEHPSSNKSRSKGQFKVSARLTPYCEPDQESFALPV
jgi:hypothetical protein